MITGILWSPRLDLNQNLIAYKAIALPLSYKGIDYCLIRYSNVFGSHISFVNSFPTALPKK